MHGLRTSKTLQDWLLASNFRIGHSLAQMQYLQEHEAEVSARKGTVERAAAHKEIPFE